jgi:hypothetical protein
MLLPDNLVERAGPQARGEGRPLRQPRLHRRREQIRPLRHGREAIPHNSLGVQPALRGLNPQSWRCASTAAVRSMITGSGAVGEDQRQPSLCHQSGKALVVVRNRARSDMERKSVVFGEHFELRPREVERIRLRPDPNWELLRRSWNRTARKDRQKGKLTPTTTWIEFHSADRKQRADYRHVATRA